MPRFRLFPLVIFLLFMTFTLRLGDFVMQLAMGREHVRLESTVAYADDKKPADAVTPTETAEKPEEKPAPKQATEVGGIENEDPFAPAYSAEEVKVLQSLSKRRDQLLQRERDMDQREKLLQAAEKKVEDKLAEMETLKKNLEDLLGKQQNIENARVTQLVKIYENMKPKDAANIFNDMNFDVLLPIIDKMAERRVAPILAGMDPVRAREVSARLADFRSLPSAQPDGQKP